MPTPVFLTVDTGLAWRHHVAGFDIQEIAARSFEPAGVGVGYHLDRFAAHRLKACFFVDPMPAVAFGLDSVRRIVDAVLDAGQEVQLLLHPNWAGARAGDRGAARLGFELCDFARDVQRDLIAGAVELLVAAGAPPPIAFRAGHNAANDDTLDALAELGFAYDASHSGDERRRARISLPLTQVAPVEHHGLVEVPATLIEDRGGRFRPFETATLSIGEMRAALDHAIRKRHVAMTVTGEADALADDAGTRPNGIRVRRFESLCAMLDEDRDALPTVHFADRPALALGFNDSPLASSTLRATWRQAEQLWSAMIGARAA